MARILKLIGVVCGMGLTSTSALGVTDAQWKRCSDVTADEMIRIATVGPVENGKQNRETGIPDSDNPWPFASYGELRSKYPECCHISREYRGDYDPVLKSHLAGGKDFPVFVVTITFPSVFKNGFELTPYQYTGRFLVTRYGEIVTEDELSNIR
uniref:hypothetical protein n=1 Tax=Neorhizobium sp. EC2-8 TaxID=3129230 RepID=UPI003100CDFA